MFQVSFGTRHSANSLREGNVAVQPGRLLSAGVGGHGGGGLGPRSLCNKNGPIRFSQIGNFVFFRDGHFGLGGGGGEGVLGGGPPRGALAGKGPQRPPGRRLDRRLEDVAEAAGGGYCPLQVPLRLALGARETVAGRSALEGGVPPPLPMHAPPPLGF